MFTYAKRLSKIIVVVITAVIICVAFIYARYSRTDFGKAFGPKATAAEKKLTSMHDNFNLCSKQCNVDVKFMEGIVFPEIMRYNSLKDDVEAESLRTLYVQFGSAYANFSIGIFQMKPTFAATVEAKAKQLLPDSILKELRLQYEAADEENIRQERVDRLQDEDWQMIYLTAFICICNKIYANKSFSSQTEKLQWYATVYNAGFDKTNAFISNKIKRDNFYLSQDMPGNKFKYAAIAAWFYNKKDF